jgi:hypothetical protein
MERDAERARTEAVRQDYLTKSGTLTSCTKHSHNFYKMLEEIEILLSLHKKDLKVWEAVLAEAQTCGIYLRDGRDLLEELRKRMAGVDEERVVEAEKLAALVTETSRDLMDLGLPPIQEIPQVLRKAWEVLKAARIVLEHLWEVHASGAGHWN